MPKISIIIPVYKSEKVLEKAVGSVLSQSFSDFEILLIDDGSPDDSLRLCREMAEKDERIRVFHKENGGICSARNLGIAKALGEYIAFLDHDDVYLSGYLQDNIALADAHQADAVKFERRRINYLPGGKTEVLPGSRMVRMPGMKDGIAVYQKKQIREYYPKIRDAIKAVYIWDGIYRRSFLENNRLRFDEQFKFGHEDIMFNLGVYAHADRMVFHAREYYQHNYRVSVSTSSTFHPDRIRDAVTTATAEAAMLRRWGYPESELLSGYMDEFFRVLHILCLVGTHTPHGTKVKLIRYFRKETIDTLEDLPGAEKTLFRYKMGHAILAFALSHGMYSLCIAMYLAYARILKR